MRSIALKILVLVIATVLVACSGFGIQFPEEGGCLPPTYSSAVADEEVMGKWARSCALCHITGEAGAPVVGDTAEWQQRLAQGEEAVLDNVLNGYNAMPPLGYCMACEVSDFRAMIAYMAGTNP